MKLVFVQVIVHQLESSLIRYSMAFLNGCFDIHKWEHKYE